MLKIAEYNTITGEKVELKELEKYGFKLYENVTPDGYEWYEKKVEYDYNKRIYYYVNINNRTLEISTYEGYDNELDDTLYDLIKDGLVIKEN